LIRIDAGRTVETDLPFPKADLSSSRIGAIVTIKGPGGSEYRGRLVKIDGESALVRVFEELAMPAEPRLCITLVQAIPKKEKMAFIVQKATELGVNRILPCLSARSAVPGEGGDQDKSHRWPDIARRAMEQCRRRVVPIVSPQSDLAGAIESFSGVTALKLILYEKERAGRLKDMAAAKEKPDSIVIVCGPEGGFTDREVAFATAKGFDPVRLGGRILRCETAALAALSIVQYEWGDL
jgi:16S rRNA (uracil1498-N3)-methyltransferase